MPRGHVDAFAGAVDRSFRRLYPAVQGNDDYTSMACEPHAQRIRDLLAEATAGVYQIDGRGFFAADGALLVAED